MSESSFWGNKKKKSAYLLRLKKGISDYETALLGMSWFDRNVFQRKKAKELRTFLKLWTYLLERYSK